MCCGCDWCGWNLIQGPSRPGSKISKRYEFNFSRLCVLVSACHLLFLLPLLLSLNYLSLHPSPILRPLSSYTTYSSPLLSSPLPSPPITCPQGVGTSERLFTYVPSPCKPLFLPHPTPPRLPPPHPPPILPSFPFSLPLSCPSSPFHPPVLLHFLLV